MRWILIIIFSQPSGLTKVEIYKRSEIDCQQGVKTAMKINNDLNIATTAYAFCTVGELP